MSQRITKALLLTATPKAKAAARFMYGVGVVAATERKTITYSAIASGLQAMKLGYTYRSLRPPRVGLCVWLKLMRR